MSTSCECYSNMEPVELARLPDNKLAEAIVASIPLLLAERRYLEVAIRAGMAPGNMKKLEEILAQNEADSGFKEDKLATIEKMHAVNLFKTKDAIEISLHQLIKNGLYEKFSGSKDIDFIAAAIKKRDDKESWQKLTEDTLMGDDGPKTIYTWWRRIDTIIEIIEKCELSAPRIRDHVQTLIAKSIAESPYYCLMVAEKFGINIHPLNYLQAADALMVAANKEIVDDYRNTKVSEACSTYEELYNAGNKQLVGEKIKIQEAYNKKGTLSAIKTASSILKFEYIPRGKLERKIAKISKLLTQKKQR